MKALMIAVLIAPILSMTACGSVRHVICDSDSDPPTNSTGRKQDISKDVERRTLNEKIERQHSSISVVDDASDTYQGCE